VVSSRQGRPDAGRSVTGLIDPLPRPSNRGPGEAPAQQRLRGAGQRLSLLPLTPNNSQRAAGVHGTGALHEHRGLLRAGSRPSTNGARGDRPPSVDRPATEQGPIESPPGPGGQRSILTRGAGRRSDPPRRDGPIAGHGRDRGRNDVRQPISTQGQRRVHASPADHLPVPARRILKGVLEAGIGSTRVVADTGLPGPRPSDSNSTQISCREVTKR
jgi:hypothetical protein